MTDRETPLAKIVGQMSLSKKYTYRRFNPTPSVNDDLTKLARCLYTTPYPEASIGQDALEAWHIRAEARTMNRDAGPLPSVYDPLIHQSHP